MVRNSTSKLEKGDIGDNCGQMMMGDGKLRLERALRREFVSEREKRKVVVEAMI